MTGACLTAALSAAAGVPFRRREFAAHRTHFLDEIPGLRIDDPGLAGLEHVVILVIPDAR